MTTIWVIIGLALLLLIVYIAAGGRKKNKRVITESHKEFPENKSTPRSAP
jgi:hypothetical protein